MKNIKDNQPKTTHAKALEKHYIKFYGVSDWATGHELIASKEALDTFDENNPPSNINDILEFFNVAKYIDADVTKLTSWNQKEILAFQSMSVKVHRIIDEYFTHLQGEAIKNIFDFGGIAYHHNHPIEQATIDKMIADGELVAESSLFSRSETDYLNYMLNDSKFDDGPSIRNRYLHGSTSGYSEQQHEQNYLTLILIFIMIIVKINDDLCISDGESSAPVFV